MADHKLLRCAPLLFPFLRSYKPPSHMTAYNITSTRLATSEFEWNNLASKNNSEIWAIRLPKDFKMSRLTNLQFQTAPSSSSSSSAHAHSSQLATLSTSKQAYALHDVSSSSTSSSSAKNHQHLPDTFQNPEFVPTLTDDKLLDFDPSSVGGGKRVRGEDSSAIAHQAEVIQEELGEDAGGGGEEMKCLKLMLPDNKRGGKYYLAPRKIDRHVILKTVYAPLSSTSTSDAISNDPANIARLLQAPTVGHTTATSGQKRPQPLEKLKYRNVPFGAVDEVIMKSDKLGADIKNRLVNGILGDVDVAMNENETGEPNSKRSKKEKDVKKEESKSERKKRKSEVGAGAGGEGVPSSQRKSKKTTESVVV